MPISMSAASLLPRVLPRGLWGALAQQLQASSSWMSNAGTVLPASFTAYDVGRSSNIKWHEGAVPQADKEKLLGQKGTVLWFTGLSGSGKSTVACTLEHALAARGKATALLDGDNIRHGLNKNLGFSAEDRAENIRRIGEVSKLFADAGIITLVSFISPYKRDRDSVRARLEAGRFVEVYMKVSIITSCLDPRTRTAQKLRRSQDDMDEVVMCFP